MTKTMESQGEQLEAIIDELNAAGILEMDDVVMRVRMAVDRMHAAESKLQKMMTAKLAEQK